MSHRASSGNHLLFITEPGGHIIEEGQTVDLTEKYPAGIDVSPYYTIRVAGGNRVVSEGAVMFKLIMKIDRVSFLTLDQMTLYPGEKFNRTYNVPGEGIGIKAEAEKGAGVDAVDLAVFGFKF
ncbi:hypothetical protein SAMN05192559_101849 [Halobacillus karajensis]|uniref:Uncharacterized protein n=1 Tax=Halobacillus karajensis TaxID=195088 RepID=A0A059NVK0_9BACI|nr:hypothetical protein [Halobacillus karajensis]CDQ18539.1 hypothetical protein BN982_00812 [Halobacillus karajensis]CDQ23389.1 hypothetical protein BN983_01616 [Halobacillus karajensis]CDQ26871.1 hypothetical protein BN981_01096 [Halobacillus karajensis]SEH50189.1 hypothetical protein SAMN05192559_101849 [Halobacillus karajensis]